MGTTLRLASVGCILYRQQNTSTAITSQITVDRATAYVRDSVRILGIEGIFLRRAHDSAHVAVVFRCGDETFSDRVLTATHTYSSLRLALVQAAVTVAQKATLKARARAGMVR